VQDMVGVGTWLVRPALQSARAPVRSLWLVERDLMSRDGSQARCW